MIKGMRANCQPECMCALICFEMLFFFRHVLPEAKVFVICSVEFIMIEIYSSMVKKQNGCHTCEVSEYLINNRIDNL